MTLPPLPNSAYPEGAQPIPVEYDIAPLLAENAMLRESLASAHKRERDAFQAVCWVVEAWGGTIVVPRVVMEKDWRITAEDTIDGGRRFTTAEAPDTGRTVPSSSKETE